MAESKRIKSDIISEIATGFCGGMAHTDGMCGAISGGILAINMMHGRGNPSHPREESEKKVQKLISTFNDRFKSTHCYELTGCDLGTAKGELDYKSKDKKKLCNGLVSEATKLTLELID